MSTVYATGGTTVLIRETNSTQYYSTDGSNWTILSWPVTIVNNNPSSGILIVEFVTNLTIVSTNQYFICGSESIQFGLDTLKNDGSRPTMTISNVSNYSGFIQNGTTLVSGNNNIFIYNLFIDGGSNTVNGGWFGQGYFAFGASNNYIINCSSTGSIDGGGGGIVGEYAAYGGNLTIRGCSSSGTIGNECGGIVGRYAGAGNNGSVVCESCWSTGAILGDGGGGIIGSNCTTVTISNCYSQGIISGNNSGGIAGSNSGYNYVTITNCYSNGTITGNNAGGISGSIAVFNNDTLTVSISNCYSTGNMINSLSSLNGGICGFFLVSGSGQLFLTISHCYTTGTLVYPSGYIIGNKNTVDGTDGNVIWSINYSESYYGNFTNWNTLNADTVLTGLPNPIVGTVWVSTPYNQPYELLNMGYSSYTLTNISNNDLVRTAYYSVIAGGITSQAITTSSYSIVNPTGNITIDSTYGIISTISSTPVNTYTLYVRSSGYNYTVYTLNVTNLICFLKGTTILCGNGEYRKIEDLKQGDLVKTYLHGNVQVDKVRHTSIHHSQNSHKRDQLFVYRKENNSFLTDDLVLTGGHSVLVDALTEKELKDLIQFHENVIYTTDDKIRLLSCIDQRAVPYEKEESDEIIYHLSLDHTDPDKNYGIWANGMLAETCQQSVIDKVCKE